jgi:hypothetical protein
LINATRSRQGSLIRNAFRWGMAATQGESAARTCALRQPCSLCAGKRVVHERLTHGRRDESQMTGPAGATPKGQRRLRFIPTFAQGGGGAAVVQAVALPDAPQPDASPLNEEAMLDAPSTGPAAQSSPGVNPGAGSWAAVVKASPQADAPPADGPPSKEEAMLDAPSTGPVVRLTLSRLTVYTATSGAFFQRTVRCQHSTHARTHTVWQCIAIPSTALRPCHSNRIEAPLPSPLTPTSDPS